MNLQLFGKDRDVGAVLLDPPWFESGGGGKGAQNHYPLIKTVDLPVEIRSCQHWDRIADDSHMYMWVTNNFLEDGLWLMRKLGFRYVTNLVWAKTRMGLGQYFRGQHELILFGVKVKAANDKRPEIKTKGTHSTLLGKAKIKHPVDASGKIIHSRKPYDLHRTIEAASPGLWLEIFAREEREGWLTWGNEIPAG